VPKPSQYPRIERREAETRNYHLAQPRQVLRGFPESLFNRGWAWRQGRDIEVRLPVRGSAFGWRRQRVAG